MTPNRGSSWEKQRSTLTALAMTGVVRESAADSDLGGAIGLYILAQMGPEPRQASGVAPCGHGATPAVLRLTRPG
ncbi:hypothetical protein GCM10009859_18490 [Kocuria salsicia]